MRSSRNRRGQGVIEFALIVVLLAVLCLVVLGTTGNQTRAFWEDNRDKLIKANETVEDATETPAEEE